LRNITPAIKYLNIVIPAKAGIQEGTGCRIKSGMTELDYLVARLIYSVFLVNPFREEKDTLPPTWFLFYRFNIYDTGTFHLPKGIFLNRNSTLP